MVNGVANSLTALFGLIALGRGLRHYSDGLRGRRAIGYLNFSGQLRRKLNYAPTRSLIRAYVTARRIRRGRRRVQTTRYRFMNRRMV